MSHLSIVRSVAESKLEEANRLHELRAEWLERILVDRSRWKGSAGVHALKQLRPLEADEQACADRTAERIRLARVHDEERRSAIVAAFEKLLRQKKFAR